MSNNSNLSLAHRKHFASMLGDDYNGLRRKAVRKFRERREFLQKALIKEFAEKRGVLEIVNQIEAAEEKCEQLRGELSKLDFSLQSDSTVEIVSFSPLDKIIDERIENEIGSVNRIEECFDEAQIAIMTVESLEEAEKILKSLSEL